MNIEIYEEAIIRQYDKIDNEEWNLCGLIDCCDKLLDNLNWGTEIKLADSDIVEGPVTMKRLIDKELAYLTEDEIKCSLAQEDEISIIDLMNKAKQCLYGDATEKPYDKAIIRTEVSVDNNVDNIIVFELTKLSNILEMLKNTSQEKPFVGKTNIKYMLLDLVKLRILSRKQGGYYVSNKEAYTELYKTIEKYIKMESVQESHT